MLSHTKITQDRTTAFRLLYAQCIILALVTFIFWLSVGSLQACSILLGGIVYILPNACFISFALKELDRQSPESVLGWFYLGEVVKIVLTIILFAICFMLLNVFTLSVPLIFATYSIMLVTNLLCLALKDRFITKNFPKGD